MIAAVRQSSAGVPPAHAEIDPMDIFPFYTSSANRNQGWGSGRAVHLGTEERWVLCGMDKVHPHLLWDSGFSIENLEECINADPDGVLCKKCRSIALSENGD